MMSTGRALEIGGMCRNGLHVITEENLIREMGSRGKMVSRCGSCVAATRKRNRDSAASREWKTKRHGISTEQYEAMLAEQDGVCLICKKPPLGRRLHIDHDHSCCPGTWSCGKCVRGLLCNKCNQGLGSFKDDPELLQAAIAYLQSTTFGVNQL